MSLNGLIGHNICSSLASFVLLTENRISSKLNNILKYSIYICIAAILLFYAIPDTSESYYSILGLSTNIKHYEIVNSYNKFKNNMNRNGSPENIAILRRAYETLSNDETRKLYHLFGDIDTDFKSFNHLHIITLSIALSYYVVSSLLSCVLNGANNFKIARYIIVLYNAIAFTLEVDARFISDSTYYRNIYYLNTLLPFQRIQLLRSISPVVMMIANVISVFFTVDVEGVNTLLWKSTISTNRIIIEKMADVLNAISYIKSTNIKANKPENNDTKDEPSSGLCELLDSMDDEQKQRLVDLLKDDNKKEQGSILGFIKSNIILVMIFFITKYIFK